MRRQPVPPFNIAIDDANAARLKARKNLSFGIGNRTHGCEVLQMHRSDRRHNRHMRTHLRRQWRDFTGMVHSNLEDAVTCRTRHPRQRQRHAPHIVIGRGRHMRRALQRKQMPQRLFGTGLSNAARHRRHARRHLEAPRPSHRLKPLQGIGDFDKLFRRNPRHVARHQCRCRPPFNRRANKRVPVARVLQSDKQIARLQRPRVD